MTALRAILATIFGLISAGFLGIGIVFLSCGHWIAR